MDDLPTEFDAIVIGTGMIESVIAAALSRIGKSVLHIDSNEYYGENWASFNLESFENWIQTSANQNSSDTFDCTLHENEKLIKISENCNIWNGQLNNFTEKLEGEDNENDLHKLSRRFSLDLCPKLLFSRGMLVQLLITSNIARYAEFKSVSRVLTWREGQLEPVPCSRADVFATKNVTVVHKRILVKILTLFANYTENLDEFKGFEHKTFLEYLKHKKLPENLIHYILYAIAMGDNTTLCLDGVKNCKAFLESLGRYGNTPFIFPIYGSGELPQCFCRLCAVFGGIYCLQRPVEALIVKDNECVGLISNKKRLNAKIFVFSSKFAPKDFLNEDNVDNLSRGIYISNRSILKGDKDSLTLLQFPPVPQVSDKSITVLELGSGTCTCPENHFVVHLTGKMTNNAESDLKHVVDALFQTSDDENETKPKILWSVTWNVSRRTSRTKDSCPKNVKICSSVDSELDYDSSISEAKRIFKELYPEEEFLPRAPDPEEIVLDVEETPNNGVEEKQNESVERNETNESIEPNKKDQPEPNLTKETTCDTNKSNQDEDTQLSSS